MAKAIKKTNKKKSKARAKANIGRICRRLGRWKLLILGFLVAVAPFQDFVKTSTTEAILGVLVMLYSIFGFRKK